MNDPVYSLPVQGDREEPEERAVTSLVGEAKGPLYPSSLASKCSTAADLVRMFGWRRFTSEILPWFLRPRYVFHSAPIGDLAPLPSPGAPVRFDLAGEDHVGVLVAMRPHTYHAPLLRRRLREGHLCLVGWVEDRPVHVRWFFVKSLHVPYLHRTLRLAPGEVFLDDYYTAAGFRDTGVSGSPGPVVRAKLVALGCDRYTGCFASWQRASRKLAERFGLKEVGGVEVAGWPGHRRVRCTGSIREQGEGEIALDHSGR